MIIDILNCGALICECEVNDMDWFLGYVLSYGKYAKVLEPEQLCVKVKNHIEDMNKLYDERI